MDEEKNEFWPSLKAVFAVMGATFAGLDGLIFPLVDKQPINYERIGLGIALFVIGLVLHLAPRIWRRVASR